MKMTVFFARFSVNRLASPLPRRAQTALARVKKFVEMYSVQAGQALGSSFPFLLSLNRFVPDIDIKPLRFSQLFSPRRCVQV